MTQGSDQIQHQAMKHLTKGKKVKITPKRTKAENIIQIDILKRDTIKSIMLLFLFIAVL